MLPLMITPGEPAGIGPDVTLLAAQIQYSVPLIAVGDPALLESRAKALNLPIELHVVSSIENLPRLPSGQLYVLAHPLSEPCCTGELNLANASYVLKTIELATQCCLEKKAAAVVTGPVHKGLLSEAGLKFTGHTEYLAQLAQVSETVMLFVIDDYKVALVTTHIPLSTVSNAITQNKLRKILDCLIEGLEKSFQLATPRIYVCGLNPHAGENGHIGNEELTTILPVIEEYQQQGRHVLGPFPADTIFNKVKSEQGHAILAMYHDQALPVIKMMGFERAVNVTLGLPFVRTSVDHGTALSIAGTSAVNAGSMIAAIQLAEKLTQA